jgi:hypothetical protein
MRIFDIQEEHNSIPCELLKIVSYNNININLLYENFIKV